MRELLFRLMKKLPDGSYEVVGYEKHLPHDNEFGIRIYHKKESMPIQGREGTQHSYWDIMNDPHMSVIHDRKDQYVVKIGDNNIFEKDEVMLTAVNDYFSNNNISIAQGGEFVGVVREMECFWGVYQEDNTVITFSDIINDEIEFTKTIGIEGVSSKNINTGE